MKQIIVFFILFFSFTSHIFAFDLFGKISESQMSQNETFTFQVEALNNQNFDEGLLKILGIENFDILSQNISVQSMSFNGVSSYKKVLLFTLQPKKSGKFILQPTYKSQTEEIIGEKFEIRVEKSLQSQDTFLGENDSKRYDFGFEIWFLGIGIILFLYFTKFYKPQKNLPVSQDIQNTPQNNGFFDNYIWSENMDYTDLRNIFVHYLEKYHGFSGNFGGNYSEISFFIENIKLDTDEKNTIKSIIFSLQSSEFSADKIDKKDLFHKICELKKFNNSI